MLRKNKLFLATTLIFTSILLINCGNKLSSKKETIKSSIYKSNKEKNKKENLEQTKYYINKNYDNLLIICKEWHNIKQLVEEKNDEMVKNKIFLIFENIKNNWIKIERRIVPNSDESENFSNQLKFIKEKQLKAIECFEKGITNKNFEFINEGFKSLKQSNEYIYSDIIPYIEEINTTVNN